MSQNYFAVERNGQCIENTHLTNTDGSIAFADIMDMSYDEVIKYDNIGSFVVSVMDAANEYFGEDDDHTFVTLVGEDDVFIWGILIGAGDSDDELKYQFIDWKQDGKQYRYEK